MFHIEVSLDELYNGLYRKGAIILAGEAFKILVTAAFILFIVHQLVTRSLLDFTRAVRSYQPGAFWPLRTRHEGAASDEFDELVDAFNALGERVVRDITERRRAEEELHRYKDQLEVLVQERTAELKTAIEKLEASNRELDEFAYVASHDLKEPLRGIHNYVSFLQEDYAAQLDEQGRSYMERMQRLAERLTALIDGLLAYSRLSSRPLAMDTVDMEAVMDGVAADNEASLVSQGVELRRASRLPAVKGNATRLGEVFQNLIANAAKYNEKAGKWVEVGCDTSGPVPVFYVRDNGIGISEQRRETVFRIFKRLHEQSKYGGGTGMGLTIVKKIVERHGGRIWLESTPSEGTTFYFTLSGET